MTRVGSLGFTRAVLPVVPPTTALPPVMPRIEIPEGLLLKWNAAMSLFHAILAIITLALGSQTLTVPLYKTVIDFVPYEPASGDDKDAWQLIPSIIRDGSLPFTNLVATFFILSSSFHLLNCTVLRRFYLSELRECRSPTRWVEYFFSAPLMILLIAYTLGVRDRSLLFAIAALVAITMPFGYWTETLARPKSPTEWTTSFAYRMLPWGVGHVPQVAAWTFILLSFYDGIADPNDIIPWFVHVILWAELALFFSFGGAALLSQWSAPCYFYRGEVAFQTLSLVSKGLLGILLIQNVLMLSRFEDLFKD